MHTREVEYIPVEWLEHAARAALHGEQLVIYSRPIRIERRWQDIPVVLDRRTPLMTSVETVESLLSDLCGPKPEGYLA